jgi:CheY-like chemotaxis protein
LPFAHINLFHKRIPSCCIDCAGRDLGVVIDITFAGTVCAKPLKVTEGNRMQFLFHSLQRRKKMILEILIVDDDQTMLDLLEMFLGGCGYNLTRATDAEQAVRSLDDRDFDLVITDLQMGCTSGFDVIQKVKNINTKKLIHKTVVIMITSCCDGQCEDEALRRGADFFLLKPFSMIDLLERIQPQEMKQLYLTASTFRPERNGQQVSGYFTKC